MELEVIQERIKGVSKLIKLITFSTDVSEGTVIEVNELADGMSVILRELESINSDLENLIQEQSKLSY